MTLHVLSQNLGFGHQFGQCYGQWQEGDIHRSSQREW